METIRLLLDEAVELFWSKSNYSRPVTTQSMKLTKQPVLQLKNVTVRYRTLHKQRKTALNSISTTFYKGDQVALVGNNGAGKSSLLKLMSGVVKPSEGIMELFGQPIKKHTPEVMSNHVAFVFQNAEEMFIDDSVRKEIEFYLKARNVEDLSLVDKLLEDFDLTHLQHQDARLLSGGQQRRVSLAIGAAMRPSIIILDEPTANLDMATKSMVVEMLERLKKHVDTIIIATHDMQLVAEWANRILVMHGGELIADDSSEAIFQQDQLLERAGLVPPQIISLCNELNYPYCPTIDSFVEYWKSLNQRGVSVGN